MHGWFGLRRREVERFKRFPIQTQQRMLAGVLARGAGTDFGRRYETDRIGTVEEFQIIESVQSTLTQDVIYNPLECTSIYLSLIHI